MKLFMKSNLLSIFEIEIDLSPVGNGIWVKTLAAFTNSEYVASENNEF